MNCFLDKQNGTVEAVLSFKRDQLQYDIENYAYIEGHVMETENTHQQHTVQDVGEEGNVDRITRVLDLAIDKCREMLYPFVKHEIHRPELDDKLKETPVYGIRLSVPQGFSQTTLNLLERLIHEYLVCRSVADWMSITNQAKTETWEAKAREAESEIRTCLHTRLARVRRRCHPF